MTNERFGFIVLFPVIIGSVAAWHFNSSSAGFLAWSILFYIGMLVGE